MKITTPINNNFNGLIFEADNDCVVYNENDHHCFIFAINPPNLDELIQDNISKILAKTAQAATDKAALLAKLGITADEAKLLLS